jgi:PKD repeat protein
MSYLTKCPIFNIGKKNMCFVNKKSLRVFSIVALSIILSACGGGASNDTSRQDIPVVIEGSGPGPAPSPAPPAELASRVQGVAPLAVFFDAINVPGVAQPPVVNSRREYADYNYTWNFNDPASGTWATSGRSKNEADGYVAAHVFETPGTYTVTLSVKNGISVDETHQVTITVEDPDTVYAGGATICVSSTSVFTGCPAGAWRAYLIATLRHLEHQWRNPA